MLCLSYHPIPPYTCSASHITRSHPIHALPLISPDPTLYMLCLSYHPIPPYTCSASHITRPHPIHALLLISPDPTLYMLCLSYHPTPPYTCSASHITRPHPIHAVPLRPNMLHKTWAKFDKFHIIQVTCDPIMTIKCITNHPLIFTIYV